jgi:[FeFe] hydrogenase H-cluster maturation GTPase HydF
MQFVSAKKITFANKSSLNINRFKMNETPRSNRCHIGIFGRRNAGKSSLLNALIGQEISIVSSLPGTTTDTVWKSVELPGIGPAVVGDTAGFDDVDAIGALRVDATRKAMARVDIAILLLGDDADDAACENEWMALLSGQHIPVVLVAAKSDVEGFDRRLQAWQELFGNSIIAFSAVTGEGRNALLESIASNCSTDDDLEDITHSLVKKGDIVVLVMPQDASAPKGRLIQPQVLTLRNLLDKHCLPLCCSPEELPQLLSSLVAPPQLVITDSQVFAQVEKAIPPQTRLTSFSVLMARHKGDIATFCQGAAVLCTMPRNGRVLIAEACSHIPQNEDIGRVKLPRLLRSKLGDELVIDIVSGNSFPKDLSGYDLVIHCGACMFNRCMVMSRVRQAKEQGVPITNYGIAIGRLTGIIDRVVI